MDLSLKHPRESFSPLATLLEPACAHYPVSDRGLFAAAYNELCRLDLNGSHVLEVCCGEGKLAACLAKAFPKAAITAVDRYEQSGKYIREVEHLFPSLAYVCGDALNLSQFPDASFDLIYGQATLHHLAHDTGRVAAEYSRLLRPGGRLVFIYEPLGHNLLVAAIRAVRLARMEAGDESNLYLSTLKEVAECFSDCQVQVFNLLNYFGKGLPSIARSNLLTVIDQLVLARYPAFLSLCANCNVIYRR